MLRLNEASVYRSRAWLAEPLAKASWAALGLSAILIPFAPQMLLLSVPVALLLAIGSAVMKRPKRIYRGPLVRADAGLATPQGETIVESSDLASGVATSNGRSAGAELATKKGTNLYLGTETCAEAEAVVDALGLGVAGRRTRIDLLGDYRPLWLFLLAMAPYVAAIGAVAFGFAGLGVGVATGLMFLAVLVVGFFSRPPVVEVGADAVVIRWRFRTEVVALGDIADVTLSNNLLVIHKVDGSEVGVPGLGISTQAAAGAGRRILQAAAARRATSTPRAALDALARRGRDLASWKRDVASVIGGGGNYRSTALDAEAVATALESPDADPAQRAAAAMVLAAHPDPEIRARVRIAVDRTASPKLRVALDRVVASADERAIEQALLEAEAEHAEVHAPRRA